MALLDSGPDIHYIASVVRGGLFQLDLLFSRIRADFGDGIQTDARKVCFSAALMPEIERLIDETFEGLRVERQRVFVEVITWLSPGSPTLDREGFAELHDVGDDEKRLTVDVWWYLLPHEVEIYKGTREISIWGNSDNWMTFLLRPIPVP